jgi:ABC-type Fe3+/spermidine/putrescine transport system ATPase subunit
MIRLHGKLGCTLIAVTHGHTGPRADETRIALMRSGGVERDGTAAEVMAGRAGTPERYGTAARCCADVSGTRGDRS